MILLHDKQKPIVKSQKRFKVIRAGRKGGKTALEIEVLVYKATAPARDLNLTKLEFQSGRKVIYIAPTQDQARNIVWQALKNRLADIAESNESRLQMKVPNADGTMTTIYVGGYENKENYRGFTDVVHITFDEVDTFKDFFIAWREIFRPMFIDTGGTADFIGTPKKENPNLRRLEKHAATDDEYDVFHFTSKDNPHVSKLELDAIEREYKDDLTSYRQEILGEYVDNAGALFKYDAIVDIFTNTVTKDPEKFLIVDIAEDGSDKTIFSFWKGLEEYQRDEYSRLNTESVISKIREEAAKHQIPYSQILVDAIGVGIGVATSSLLDGIVGYKGSYQAFKTDMSIVYLPNVGYTKDAPKVSEYRNLRNQCIFVLADLVNNHKIASKVQGAFKEKVIEELMYYQDVSLGDGKRMATKKDDIKKIIGRSPDHSDCFQMRMYFVIKGRLLPMQSEQKSLVVNTQRNQWADRKEAKERNSNK